MPRHAYMKLDPRSMGMKVGVKKGGEEAAKEGEKKEEGQSAA